MEIHDEITIPGREARYGGVHSDEEGETIQLASRYIQAVSSGSAQRIITVDPWVTYLGIEDDGLMLETVWETTMTVGCAGDNRGYFSSDTSTPAGILTDDSFTWRDTTYIVSQLYDVENDNLMRIVFDNPTPDDRSPGALIVDGYHLPLDRAALNHGRVLEWLHLPATLNAGEGITVSLVQLYSPPEKQGSLNPVTETAPQVETCGAVVIPAFPRHQSGDCLPLTGPCFP